jgi:hypothetical protein
VEIGEEHVTLACGMQVLRANLQPSVVMCLIDGARLRQKYVAFQRAVPEDVRSSVMTTARGLLREGRSANDALAFGLWLLAISERFPAGTQLEEIADKIIRGEIKATDYVTDSCSVQ